MIVFVACVACVCVFRPHSYQALARFNQKYERAFVLQGREDIR